MTGQHLDSALLVTKRDGRKEPLDIDKITRVCEWAAEGLEDISVSNVMLKAKIQFFNGITTSDIHKAVVKSATDLISPYESDYQYFAARLESYQLRKEVFGQFEPPTLWDQINKVTKLGFYDESLLENYSKEEIDELDKVIDHSKDDLLTFAGIKQLISKYLVRNRHTKKYLETPQFANMLVAMVIFGMEKDKKQRMEFVKKFYRYLSDLRISLPSPIMGGVRTKTRQYSSCVLIESGDSLDSINGASNSIVNYVSKRAGIGLNVGRIRGVGSPIRGGEVTHTGIISFIKLFEAATKSCNQGKLYCPALA